MNLNDLKEQLAERWKEISAKVAESDSAILVMERYRNLSPSMQKIVVGALIVLGGYLVYSIPAAFVDSARVAEENFEYNRGLIRGLFRAARNPPISADRFTGPDADRMRSQVESFMAANRVLETQKGPFAPANRPLIGKNIPAAIKQTGMTFELKKLNLHQVVNLSQQIAAMHPNAKLAGVEIQADSEDPHYFNVKYTVSSLSLPVKTAPEPATGRQRR